MAAEKTAMPTGKGLVDRRRRSAADDGWCKPIRIEVEGVRRNKGGGERPL